jgi:hypothetical protein
MRRLGGDDGNRKSPTPHNHALFDGVLKMPTTQEQSFRIATEAAPFINGAWRFNNTFTSQCHRQGCAVLSDDRQPGRAIEFFASWSAKDRITIKGTLPSLGAHDRYTNQITVAPHRSGKAVAGDINRRLLPDYLDAWTKRQAEIAADRARVDLHKIKLDMIKSYCPELRARYGGKLEDTHDLRTRFGELRLWYQSQRADLTLALSFDDLIRVLHFLKAEEIEVGKL